MYNGCMTSQKKWFLLVSAVLLLLVVAVLVYSFKYKKIASLSPEAPVFPYISENFDGISQIGWEVWFYQPIFLGTFSRNGADYIKTALRSESILVKTLDILVGGTVDGQELEMVKVEVDSGSAVEPTSIKELESIFKEGEQIRVAYLRGVSSNFDFNAHSEFCGDSVRRICRIAQLSVKEKFTALPAVYLSKVLTRE